MTTTAPWYERIPLLGNLGLPIAQKEVRSLIRRNRYFWSQFIYLSFLAVGVVVVVTGSQGLVTQQEAIGQRLFNWFFLLQSFLVALVFPAFAATSFSSEKAERSWELLVTTDMRPYELVWGKFIGIFGNCCYFLLVTLPLLGVCILFGGVALSDAFENYLLLVLEAALLCIYGIWVSSSTASNIRAIMATYAPVLLLGWIPIGAMSELTSRSGGAQGFVSFLLADTRGHETVLLVAAGYVVVAFFTFCFVSAVLRLSSPESNQDSPLRVYAVLTLVCGLGVASWLLSSYQAKQAGWGPSADRAFVNALAVVLAFALPVALLSFSSSRVDTPMRTARRARQAPLRVALTWLLLPGGVRGICFSAAFAALTYFGVYWIAAEVAGLGEVSVSAELQHVADSELTLGSRVFGVLAMGYLAYSAFAFFLSTIGVRGFLNWAIVIASGVLLSLLAVVYWVQLEPQGTGDLSPFFATSIVVSLMTYLDPENSAPWLVRSCLAVHAIGAALAFLAGCVVLKLRGLPLFKVHRPGVGTAPMPRRVS